MASFERVHSLDYLRGVMAISVMLYHFMGWSVGVPESETLIGRLGVYAVSSFYIISGASLYLVYRRKTWNVGEVGFYIAKRYLRIAPVFWLATLLMIVFYIIKTGAFDPDWPRYFSNFSLTFGFYSPRDYIPGGGWSIGNEMTFYAIFPLMIMATVKPRVFLSVLAFSFLIYCYFAFFVLSNEFTLAEQWNIYINPLNQSFLFASGIAIGWFRDNSRNPSQVGVWVIGAVSLLFMMFYPASGNQINIVAGINRILFTVFCIGLCYSAINCNIEKDLVLTKILKFFGDISYSLYLLHSVVGVYFLQLVLPKIGQFSPMAKLYILFLVVLPSIIFISFLIYRFIEIPFMKMGKRLAVVRGDKTAGVYNLGKLRDGY